MDGTTMTKPRRRSAGNNAEPKAAPPEARLSARERETVDEALRILERAYGGRGRAGIRNPSDAADYLRLRLAPEERELFCALLLDAQHRVIAFEVISAGTVDQATVHPREVVKAALRHNAASAVLAHNHPSGHAEPSAADVSLTASLKEALGLVGVRVLDHLVVGGTDVVSLAERGAC